MINFLSLLLPSFFCSFIIFFMFSFPLSFLWHRKRKEPLLFRFPVPFILLPFSLFHCFVCLLLCVLRSFYLRSLSLYSHFYLLLSFSPSPWLTGRKTPTYLLTSFSLAFFLATRKNEMRKVGRDYQSLKDDPPYRYIEGLQRSRWSTFCNFDQISDASNQRFRVSARTCFTRSYWKRLPNTFDRFLEQPRGRILRVVIFV